MIAVVRRDDRWGSIGQPKSKAGTRMIPFSQAARDALISWKQCCPSSKLNLVFPSSRGTVQNQSNIMTRYFRLMQIEAGIDIEVVKLEKDGKGIRGKGPSTVSMLSDTSALPFGSKRTTAPNVSRHTWVMPPLCRLTTLTDTSSISGMMTRKR